MVIVDGDWLETWMPSETAGWTLNVLSIYNKSSVIPLVTT